MGGCYTTTGTFYGSLVISQRTCGNRKNNKVALSGVITPQAHAVEQAGNLGCPEDIKETSEELLFHRRMLWCVQPKSLGKAEKPTRLLSGEKHRHLICNPSGV